MGCKRFKFIIKKLVGHSRTPDSYDSSVNQYESARGNLEQIITGLTGLVQEINENVFTKI